ncbi:MAG: tRNA pseudouridine(55) synthase TruB [Pseudomonadota bacterium]|nr:tRNA pseudouridine(55) synthase TruB [Pseudomonadota bacterium]
MVFSGKRPLHGWLVVDKPVGPGSTQVLGRVKYLLKPEKAGHGGTLDPLASGILPIAFGEATKTVPWVMDALKTYRFTARWGEARNTDDAEGEVTATSPVRPGAEDIHRILPLFHGDILQVPPAYSALKIGGQRSYTLARGGQDVEHAPRRVRVDRLSLVDCPDPDRAVFEVVCGKGTYVRSLARDMALKLGTVGYVSGLRRLAVGPFSLKDALALPDLEAAGPEAVLARIIPLEKALATLPVLEVTAGEALALSRGQALEARSRDTEGGVFLVMHRAHPVALASIRDGKIRVLRGLNMPGTS